MPNAWEGKGGVDGEWVVSRCQTPGRGEGFEVLEGLHPMCLRAEENAGEEG